MPRIRSIRPVVSTKAVKVVIVKPCPAFPELFEFHKGLFSAVRGNMIPLPTSVVMSLLIKLSNIVSSVQNKEDEGYRDFASLNDLLAEVRRVFPSSSQFVQEEDAENAVRLLDRSTLQKMHDYNLKAMEEFNHEQSRLKKPRRIVDDDDDDVLLIPSATVNDPTDVELQLKKRCAELEEQLAEALKRPAAECSQCAEKEFALAALQDVIGDLGAQCIQQMVSGKKLENELKRKMK